jgi:hypothetical protein
MQLLILLIILFSLYLIYRLSFPDQAVKQEKEKTPPKQSDGYEAVPKSRFVLPAQSNSAQHDDRGKESDKQDKTTDIFAAGNEKPDAVVIPLEALDEVFGEDVHPEDLDIEPDESESESDLDADEEAEELRLNAGEIEGYAGGYTYDELAAVIHEADRQSGEMTKADVEKLRDFSQTDMFERLVSGDADRAVRIASILDRNEQCLAEQDKGVADDSDDAYRHFDIEQFLS